MTHGEYAHMGNLCQPWALTNLGGIVRMLGMTVTGIDALLEPRHMGERILQGRRHRISGLSSGRWTHDGRWIRRDQAATGQVQGSGDRDLNPPARGWLNMAA